MHTSSSSCSSRGARDTTKRGVTPDHSAAAAAVRLLLLLLLLAPALLPCCCCQAAAAAAVPRAFANLSSTASPSLGPLRVVQNDGPAAVAARLLCCLLCADATRFSNSCCACCPCALLLSVQHCCPCTGVAAPAAPAAVVACALLLPALCWRLCCGCCPCCCYSVLLRLRPLYSHTHARTCASACRLLVAERAAVDVATCCSLGHAPEKPAHARQLGLPVLQHTHPSACRCTLPVGCCCLWVLLPPGPGSRSCYCRPLLPPPATAARCSCRRTLLLMFSSRPNHKPNPPSIPDGRQARATAGKKRRHHKTHPVRTGRPFQSCTG